MRIERSTGRDRVDIVRGWCKGPRQLVQRLGQRPQAQDVPHCLLAKSLLPPQRRKQARVDDRGLAAARAPDDGYGVDSRALVDLGDKFVNKPCAAEE
jgi:hypothetical protein